MAVEDAWDYTVVQRHGLSPRRINRLLLMLPHIRHVALNAIAHIFELKQQAKVPIEELLMEMMSGHKSSSQSSPPSSQSPSDTGASTSP